MAFRSTRSSSTPQATAASRLSEQGSATRPPGRIRDLRRRAYRALFVGALSIVTLVALSGPEGGGNTRPVTSSVSSPVCSACFAAQIASPTLEAISNASPSGLADYGTVVLYQPETWDAISRRNVDSALALLPEDVRGELGNPALGPVFVTVNNLGSLISGKQPYGKAANFFSTSDASSQVVLYPDQPVKVILHELGHAYNLRATPGGSYGQAYLSPELQDFMRAVGWRVLTPAAKLVGELDQANVAVALDGPNPWTDLSHNDPLEDFANSFALFFAAPDQLQQLSPARYMWFAGHFAS